MQAYERLVAWQRSHDVVLLVYRASAGWPATERYGLVSQARRAAASIPTNIAEGAAKRGSAEFRRFLDIANGSLAELSYLLRLARDLGYLSAEEWDEIEKVRDEAGRLTWHLYRSLTPKASPVPPVPPASPASPAPPAPPFTPAAAPAPRTAPPSPPAGASIARAACRPA